jgi:hypothetical protein
MIAAASLRERAERRQIVRSTPTPTDWQLAAFSGEDPDR